MVGHDADQHERRQEARGQRARGAHPHLPRPKLRLGTALATTVVGKPAQRAGDRGSGLQRSNHRARQSGELRVSRDTSPFGQRIRAQRKPGRHTVESCSEGSAYGGGDQSQRFVHWPTGEHARAQQVGGKRHVAGDLLPFARLARRLQTG